MVIVIQCKDKVGLVADIAGVMAKFNINILTMREFVDINEGAFFARLVVEPYNDIAVLQNALQKGLPSDAMVKVNPEPEKKIVVLVTKEYHCLSDILIRNHFKTLGASVEAVIGNYSYLSNICERFGVPFYEISHEEKDKVAFENEIKAQLAQYKFDYLVLAKFMRILSPEFVASYPNQIINIHHSFLPAFIGANPYKRAFHRGVKLIGATAHFVTNDLDEGPIIVQQTIPVNHNYSLSDMIRAGKEIETSVLAKALHFVFEDRVFVFNNKTIVFE
ncbi:formyltetrahydrofolate deformylase [Pseudopedobacter saltans DSM 12145]|uniref:Formyltetrahydrofolate deformylase n=1 Tax=Pseudopedobacter saltans (strain ATCC 51119 / DSM 12145 / JCM 21818 / CCUG 39354 / LMG 10337 / NBRC 100064 / NCIMB 13643) TaxID=762903 RepID=F0SBM4_PSESL|nr:formyltetrahydrofolate deformylase [Pseudopedobacter saltans]ADY52715.1 formyltetrahydrofolate deformylase [Pseudopedobacter saltans DSM 12145]